jgi:hypothetical protein
MAEYEAMNVAATSSGMFPIIQMSYLIVTLKWLLIMILKWYLISSLVGHFLYYSLTKSVKRLVPKTEEHRNRDKKYAAFVRGDLEKLRNTWSFNIWCFTGVWRLIFMYSVLAIMMIVSWFFTLFKSDKINFSGRSYEIIRFWQRTTALNCLITCGISDWETREVDVDYSEYLGPDW